MTDILEQTFEKYESFLLNKFGEEKFKEFKDILLETGAMIAGGSVLHYLMYENKKYSGDIDIYVNIKNAEKIRNFLSNLPDAYIDKSRTVNKYNKTFLQINKIKTIVKFKSESKESSSRPDLKSEDDSFDLMYIRNSKSVEDVVTNFDFTCCQTYYDGKTVKTTHLELTLCNEYIITKDFVKFYKTPDKYGKRRVDKYTAKGFKKVGEESVPINSIDLDNPILNIYDYIFGWTFNYDNFITDCRLNAYYKRFIFNKHTTLQLDSPKIIKCDKVAFNCDLLDEEDFNSLDAYKTTFDEIKYKEIEDNVRLAYHQLKNLNTLNKIGKKDIKTGSLKKINEVITALEKEFSKEFLNEIPDITPNKKYNSNNEFLVENLEVEITITDYLNLSDSHFIIVIDDKYYGYDRKKMPYHRIFYIQNKTKKIYVKQFNTNTYISNRDYGKFEDSMYQIYKFEDAGIELKLIDILKPQKLKNLMGMSYDKFIKNL
jgi:hypothetical protein